MSEIEAPEASRQSSPIARRVIRPKVRRARLPIPFDTSREQRPSLLLTTAAIAVLALLAVRLPGAGANGLPDTVDGLSVMSVSEVFADRANGLLAIGPVAIGGYWSNGAVPLTCAPTPMAGELEIPCYDGLFGITELAEPIVVMDRFGNGRAASGPHLTPFIPVAIAEASGLFSLPVINGQRYPPVPIVVVGHFDDERADSCSAAAKRACRDRLVVDRIAVFDPKSVATPAPSPTPTPFPSPGPAGLFDERAPERCAGDVEYSFVGWTTTAELDLAFEREGHVWAAITAGEVLLGDDEWTQDPDSREEFRWWGRLICVAEEGQPDVILYGAVPGTTFKEWRDGSTTKADLP